MGNPTDWKLTGSQRLNYRSESSEPHIKLPCVAIWHWEKEPPEHLTLQASGACAQELHGSRGNGDPILKRRTQTFMCTGSQGKAVSIGVWFRPDCSSWRTSWENKGECGLCGGRTLEAKPSGIFSSLPFSGGGHFGKIWPHPSALKSPRPNNNPGGITALPISKQAA